MNRRRIFLVAVILLSLVFVLQMVSPYAGYLLTGLLLAFIGFPAQKRLRRYMPESVSASIIVLGTLFLAVLPFVIITAAVAGDASSLVNNISQGVEFDFDVVEQKITELTGQSINLEERLTNSLKKLAGAVASNASSILGFASSILIGLTLMLFTQFYGVKDGGRFIEWTKKFDVMPTEVQEDLYERTSDTTKAVVKGHIFVAIAQGIVAGIGLAVVGIPNFVFWTFVMMILGFIPLIGTVFVWLPAALWLLANGNINSGILLLAWGAVVVGAVDNLLRPFLVDDDVDLHPMFVILGVIGGTGVFGVIGIFLGPVIFGVAKALLEIYIEDYKKF